MLTNVLFTFWTSIFVKYDLNEGGKGRRTRFTIGIKAVAQFTCLLESSFIFHVHYSLFTDLYRVSLGRDLISFNLYNPLMNKYSKSFSRRQSYRI